MQLMRITALALAMGLAVGAHADTAADLGGKLTPAGAEKAANADDVQPEANVAEPRKKDGRTE